MAWRKTEIQTRFWRWDWN